MLRGSVIHDYSYDYDGGSFSDLSLRRMDRDQGPWDLALYVLAMTLAGLAWLTLVLGMRWQLRTKAVAALPGPATLAAAGADAIGDAVLGQDNPLQWLLRWAIELSAIVALVAISAWQPDVHGRRFLRLLVVLWGTTAFGFIHVMADYAIMSSFSDANWDSPPRTGYPHRRNHHRQCHPDRDHDPARPTHAIMILLAPHRGAEDKSASDQESGSLTLT